MVEVIVHRLRDLGSRRYARAKRAAAATGVAQMLELEHPRHWSPLTSASHLLFALLLLGPPACGSALQGTGWEAPAAVDLSWIGAEGGSPHGCDAEAVDAEDSEDDPRVGALSSPPTAAVASPQDDGHVDALGTSPRRCNAVAAHAPRGPPAA